MVDLNIGGERMLTVARSTLTQEEVSMLGAMFSGRHMLTRDTVGRVYIDRDPKPFSYVLDYLRNGGVLPANIPVDEQERARVQQEFNYFLLDVELNPPAPKSLAAIFAEHAYTEHTLHPPASGAEDRMCYDVSASDRYAVVLHQRRTSDASGSVGRVAEAWDLVDGVQFNLEAPDGDRSPMCNPSIHEHNMVAVHRPNKVVVWDLSRGGRIAKTLELEAVEGQAGAFTTQDHCDISQKFVVFTQEGAVYVWDRQTWARRHIAMGPGRVLIRLYESDLAVLRASRLTNYDLARDAETCHWACRPGSAYRHIVRSGHTAVCSAIGNSSPVQFDIFDLSTRAYVRTIGPVIGALTIQHMLCSHDTVAIMCDDATRLVDLKTGQTVIVDNSKLSDFSLLPCGQRLVRVPRRWAPNTPKVLTVYEST
jgi:hypothetical protein